MNSSIISALLYKYVLTCPPSKIDQNRMRGRAIHTRFSAFNGFSLYFVNGRSLKNYFSALETMTASSDPACPL